MSVVRVVLKNIAWNWLGLACDTLAVFFLTPALIRRLGEDSYGLWILIGSLTGYFGLLDLGVRGSVGRFLAYHRAREDSAEVEATLSTAAAFTAAIGLAVLLLIPLISWLFFASVPVPAGRVPVARLALCLVCVNLALSFPLSLFDGMLWAAQRFDVLNAVDIGATAARVGLTLGLVRGSGDLATLAAVTVGVGVGANLLKAVAALAAYPGLRLGTTRVGTASARALFGFGLGNFLLTVGRMTRIQFSPFLIGTALGLPAVAVYSIARRLFDYSERVVVAGTGVLTPLATSYHAQGLGERQRSLLIQGGRCCLATSLVLMSLFALLGRATVRLWLGGRFSESSVLATVLLAGEVLPLSQSITGGVMLGAGKVGVLARLSMWELGLGLGLAALAARPTGLVGICAAFALSATIFRGVGMMAAGCRELGMGIGFYARHALLPPALCAVAPSVLSAALVATYPPRSWATVLWQGAAIVAGFALAFLPLVPPDRRRAALDTLFARLGGRPPERAR